MSWKLKVVNSRVKEYPEDGVLKVIYGLGTDKGTYIVSEFDNVVRLKFLPKTGDKTAQDLGKFPSVQAAKHAAEAEATGGPGGDSYHFGKSNDPSMAPPQEDPKLDPEAFPGAPFPIDPAAGEDDATAASRAQGDKYRRELGGVPLTNKDGVKGGTGRRVGGGLPSLGDTHAELGDVAPRAAGFRSAVERVREIVLEFLRKYGQHYAGDASKIEQEIAKLDSASSELIMTRVNTLGNLIHAIYSNARDAIAEKVEERHWSQKFPKYTKKQFVKALRTAKGSEKYQKDPATREKVDSAIASLVRFQEGDPDTGTPGMREWLAADPDFKQLEKDYALTSGAVRLDQAAAGKLFGSTLGTGKADKVVGQRHQKFRPVNDPSGEQIGFAPMGPATTIPKDSPYSFTDKWKQSAGMVDDPAQLAPHQRKKAVYNYEKEIGDLFRDAGIVPGLSDLGVTGKDPSVLSKYNQDKLKDLEYGKAKMKSPDNFIVRKAKKEAFDYWLDEMNEISSGELPHNWIDELF